MIKIWDIGSSKCIKTIKDHSDEVRVILILSNNQFVTCSNDKSIKIFNLNSYKCLRTFKHQDSVNFIDKISHYKIVSCSDDKTIRVWSLDCKISLIKISCDKPTCLRTISDELIICAHKLDLTYKCFFKIWNIQNGSCLKTIKIETYTSWINFMIKLTNEKIVSCSSEGNIEIIDLLTKEIKTISLGNKQIRNHDEEMWCIAQHTNNTIITCSMDKLIRVFNIETGECVETLEGHSESVNYLELFEAIAI